MVLEITPGGSVQKTKIPQQVLIRMKATHSMHSWCTHAQPQKPDCHVIITEEEEKHSESRLMSYPRVKKIYDIVRVIP